MYTYIHIYTHDMEFGTRRRDQELTPDASESTRTLYIYIYYREICMYVCMYMYIYIYIYTHQ